MTADSKSQVSHAPGPWFVSHEERGMLRNQREVCAIFGSDKVIHIGPEDYRYSVSMGEEAEANARLIAAAPDLLAACEAQHKAIDHLLATIIGLDNDFMPTKSPVWPMLLQGNAAISKAKAGA